MPGIDESGNHSIQQHNLSTRCDDFFVDSELSLRCHGELEQVGVVAAFAQHHEDIGQLDVRH